MFYLKFVTFQIQKGRIDFCKYQFLLTSNNNKSAGLFETHFSKFCEPHFLYKMRRMFAWNITLNPQGIIYNHKI